MSKLYVRGMACIISSSRPWNFGKLLIIVGFWIFKKSHLAEKVSRSWKVSKVLKLLENWKSIQREARFETIEISCAYYRVSFRITYRHLMFVSERYSLSIAQKQSQNLPKRALSSMMQPTLLFMARCLYQRTIDLRCSFQVYRYRMSEDRSPGQASGSFFREFSGVPCSRETRVKKHYNEELSSSPFIFLFLPPSSINYQSRAARSSLW